MSRPRLFLLVLGIWACVAGIANANPGTATYAYVTDFGTSAYFANFNQTVTVNVYLQETLTGGAASVINGDGGLYNAAVKLATPSQSPPFVANATSAVTNNTQFNPNIGTAGVSGAGQTNKGYIYNLTDTQTTGAFASGPTVSTNGGNLNYYYIGTFTFTTGVTNGTTTYNITPFSKTGSNTTTWGNSNSGFGYDLDLASGTATNLTPGGTQAYAGTTNSAPWVFTITVAAVPEPTSMLLCGMAVCGMGFGAWRKRNAKPIVEDVELNG
jgi:hypothetical protein